MLSGTRLRGLVLLVSLLLSLAFAACGKAGSGFGQPTPTSSESSSLLPTVPPTGSPSSSPSDQPPRSYADAEYGFKVSYPADFTTMVHLVETLRESHDGFLRVVALSERRFEGKEAPGVVNIRVYERGSGSTTALDDWVREHSAPKSEEDRQIYFKDTTNLETITVAGRQGVSFEWDASESGIARTVAFFYESYVVAILWTGGGGYESTIVPAFDYIVSSWKDA